MNRNVNKSETVNINTLPVHTRATIIVDKLQENPMLVVDGAGREIRKKDVIEAYDKTFKMQSRLYNETKITKILLENEGLPCSFYVMADYMHMITELP